MSVSFRNFKRPLVLVVVCCLIVMAIPVIAGAEDISGHWAGIQAVVKSNGNTSLG